MRTDPKAPRRDARGVTLLEVMISMAIFAIGLAGLARMQIIAAGVDGHATRTDQATTLAVGLAGYLGSTAPYTSSVLGELNTAVDTDLTDDQNTCATTPAAGFQADHTDADLGTANLLCSQGPSTTCFQGPDPGATPYEVKYQRYWRIKDVAPGPGDPASPGKTIVVFVRWRDPGSGSYRCVHQLVFRPNPTVMAP